MKGKSSWRGEFWSWESKKVGDRSQKQQKICTYLKRVKLATGLGESEWQGREPIHAIPMILSPNEWRKNEIKGGGLDYSWNMEKIFIINKREKAGRGLNMAHRLNWTLRRERGRERTRGARDQVVCPEPRDWPREQWLRYIVIRLGKGKQKPTPREGEFWDGGMVRSAGKRHKYWVQAASAVIC